MREAVNIKLKYLVKDRDRHGVVRYYVRRAGHAKIKIEGIAGSAEFLTRYQAAIKVVAGTPALALADHASFASLTDRYLSSIEFRTELAHGSQAWRKAMMRKLCKSIGSKPYARLEARNIHAWMDARADRPEAANNLLKCLRGLFSWAVKRQLAKTNPTLGISKTRTYSTGFHTWTVPEVMQYLNHHGPGTNARRALCIALFAGLRRQDVAKLGRQHTANGQIIIKAAKSRRKKQRDLVLDILPALQEELDATPKNQMTYLQSERGRPFSPASLGNAARKWCDDAGLPNCTLHGLRKAGATIAADNGATDRQLMAIYGWTKADMATLYTEGRNQEKLASDGLKFLHLEQPENKTVQPGVSNLFKKRGNSND